MDRPLSHAENEEFLRKLKERRIWMGVDASKIDIQFEDLTVKAKIHGGRRALPTLVNSVVNATKELVGLMNLCPVEERHVKILNSLKGLIKSSRMTLILGPPGSGKSTLLRALSGKLEPNLKVDGRVAYKGQKLSPSAAQCTCVYVSQHDVHHAEMTVRETLDFSSRMFGSSNAFEILGEGIGRKNSVISKLDPEIDAFVKAITGDDTSNLTTIYFMKLLGLNECADTIVGDEMRRGISGGQKKRVTIGEMLVGLARCYFMDDISTGLDSSTTFEIVKFLSQMAHLMDLTLVISLLQPPSETFELFDDIILLSEGQIAYQGPRANVLEFFESMGFKCPARKNIADFLQEVTSKMDQAQYWDGNPREYTYIPVERFAELFYNFHIGRHLEDELHNPNTIDKGNLSSQIHGGHRISKWKIFKACFSREFLLAKRNSPVHIFKVVQIAILALVIMTLFLRTDKNPLSIAEGNKFMGAIFTGLVVVKFNGMVELSMTIKRLPIFYKQRDLLFLPAWSLLSSIFILSIPMSLIEAGTWTFLTYFLIGYAPSASRFFLHFLILFSIHQMSMALFRFIAAVGRTQVIANVLGIVSLIAIYILGGFVISKDSIKSWLIWGYWASPLTYGQNALALNEFLDERWSMKVSFQIIGNFTLGEAVLRSRGMLTEWRWFWACVGALLAFSLSFNILTIFAFVYLNSPRKHQVNINMVSEDIRKNGKLEKQTTKTTAPSSGMVMPFQPLTLAFRNISYYVDMPTEMKKRGVGGKRLQLLRDVSGVFRPGVLTALMGITGAGKTTLLDVLAGRKTGGYIEGTITISGYPKKQETFARISGYCEQMDVHSPFLTVYESLWYSAWLRLPSHIDTHKRNLFVEEVMGLVELVPLKNAMVGQPGMSGLSAEQRKRLTIAVELVSSPSIIFMDEPTTGLDARSAAIVMRTVRNTVDTGRTVVCTIHQPSIEIFEAFDELLLMKRGGQLIYGGPLGALSMEMIQYFEAIPGVPEIKNGQNPAAWMLDITSYAMECNISVDYEDIFCNSSRYKENIELVDELSKPKPNSEELHFSSRYAQSFNSQLLACLWKQHRSYWKDPEHNVIRFITTIITALVFGVVFWQIASKITVEQDIFNILGVMYGSSLFLGFANASVLQPIVGMERTVFYRERSSGMYSSMPYALSQVAVEIPYIIAQVLIFSSMVYLMIGLDFIVGKFLWFALFMLLSFIYFSLFGMMTVALTPVQEMAALLSFLIFVMWNIFSGFVIPQKMIPAGWRWFYWANPAAWTVYGIMFSQLGDHTELIHVPGEPDETVKGFLEDYLGIQQKYFPLVVSLHFVAIAVFMFVFFIGIKYINFQRR